MKRIPSVTPPSLRPTTIHTHPCVNCPSTRAPDAECIDIKEHAPREEQIASVFACGWRAQQLCKGYCDYLSITEADLTARQAASGTAPRQV